MGGGSIHVLLSDRFFSTTKPARVTWTYCVSRLNDFITFILLVTKSLCTFGIVLYLLAIPDGFHRGGAGVLFYSFEYYLECFSVYCF